MANFKQIFYTKCVLGNGQYIGVGYLLYDNHDISLGVPPGRIIIWSNYRSYIRVDNAKKRS